MNKRIILMASFLFVAGFQPAAQALALGKLELKSHLNQPLNAVIPLVYSQESELEGLRLGVVIPEGQSLGAQVWHDLRVELVRNSGEQSYLKVSSKNTLREPALSFLLDMRWSGGHMQKEFSILLNLGQ